MIAKAYKTDTDLKNDVLSELNYDPCIFATDISVLVKDGIVTIHGYAASYGDKWNAVCAAKRVAGVKSISDDIEVRLPTSKSQSDADIAAAASNQIAWSTMIPLNSVEVTVHKGRITLGGEVEWWYQKNAAENSVTCLPGVNGVSNLISIKPKLKPTDFESAIVSAFERNALLDAKKIDVKTSGDKVTLCGEVGCCAERDEAERIAWAAPGVFSVDNQITVKGSWGVTLDPRLQTAGR